MSSLGDKLTVWFVPLRLLETSTCEGRSLHPSSDDSRVGRNLPSTDQGNRCLKTRHVWPCQCAELKRKRQQQQQQQQQQQAERPLTKDASYEALKEGLCRIMPMVIAVNASLVISIKL